jgi:hypothetical protein
MPYLWRVTSGALPDGLTLTTRNSGRSGYLEGQPTKVGDYSWTVTVSDETFPDALTASHSYTMSISSSLYLRGQLINESGLLPDATVNVPLDFISSNKSVTYGTSHLLSI